ncbi:MAG TPA: hypothetical protein VF181_04060, partial [Balneolaceae bacterium]
MKKYPLISSSYALYIITSLLIILITAVSCDNRVTQITQPQQESLPEEVTFIPFQQSYTTGIEISKHRKIPSKEAPSEFGCALSTLNESEDYQRYRYQAFYITFPQKVMDEANGKVIHPSFVLRSDRAEERTPQFMNLNGVVRYLICRIPDSPKAVEILEKEMQKFGKQSWYNDIDSSKKIHKKRGEWTCSYVPGDGYGNTSSTITIGGEVYVTYYFHEECSYSSGGGGGSTGPAEPELNDPFGGGGGGIGDSGDTNEDPNPCDSGQKYPMTSDGEVIGCGSDIPTNVISLYPTVKYPPNSTYAQDYPKLTEYLKNKLPTLKDNETIISAIEKYTSLSREEIKEQLQWGEGPTLKIAQLADMCNSCSVGTIGLFDPDTPNTIYLDIDYVTTFEATYPGTLM